MACDSNIKVAHMWQGKIEQRDRDLNALEKLKAIEAKNKGRLVTVRLGRNHIAVGTKGGNILADICKHGGCQYPQPNKNERKPLRKRCNG